MKIEQCKIDVKCDVDGCNQKADYQLIFDGVTPQYRFCKTCILKIKNALSKLGEGVKKDGREK